ncbi:MAG: signal peptidase I [Nanoarchaeota archaeon]|nr:signal peptidase I [Nanoarchaeota archaeon]
MDKNQIKVYLKKTWDFIWHSNSIWSWIVNIILAFILIKFIVYPLLGLILATSHPIVAVVSESMEHQGGFDQWWSTQDQWYQNMGISEQEFKTFPYQNGFNKGDIMVLYGKNPGKIKIGDILVFSSRQPNPIIHRVVKKWSIDNEYHFQTKGDHNKNSISNYVTNSGTTISQDFAGAIEILDETDITEDEIIGVGVIKIPLLGWIKVLFTDYIANPIVNLFRR